MEINLFSKCIKDLIVENDKVDVPYLGTFTAEMMPASYSDKQTTIHPPYRKMTFHKAEVTMADGAMLLEKVRRETGVSTEQASVELGWCLSRLCSELEGRKSCQLPGLGVMRANARNEFFFVPDDDLDIWPDGLGLHPISIKVSEKEEMPDQVRHDEVVEQPEQPTKAEPVIAEMAGGISSREHFSCEREEIPEPSKHPEQEYHLGWNWPRIILIVILVLALLFIAASYLFTEQMSPILDRLLYTKEELELWKG